jgi:hypothetical protein
MKAEKSTVIEYWRTRAKETRLVGETMQRGASREMVLQIANEWEQMAQSMAQSAEEQRTSEENIAGGAGITLFPASSENNGDANPRA